MGQFGHNIMKKQVLTKEQIREIVREEIEKQRQELANSLLKFQDKIKITDSDLEELGFNWRN